jgi:hypothetical protein
MSNNDASSVETEVTEQNSETDTTAQVTESGGDSAAGLTSEERSELDRLRAIHKDEKRWESRAKSNFADAEKFRELAKAIGGGDSKTDFDPKSAIEELRSELQLANRDRLRAEVARVKNVDPRYLIGETQEEMTASADEYIADVEARVKAALGDSKTVTKSPATESTSTVRSGDRVEGPRQITSEAELKKLSPDDQMKAYKDGRLDKLMGR